MTQKQVRRSKKELAHEANRLASLTRRRQKVASKTRTTVFTDFDVILENCGLPDAADLATAIDALIRGYREGRGTTDDHDRLIFDPTLVDLTTLPIGVLDHKELPLPAALIPRSREALLAHCERMIVRSRAPDIIAYVVAGWPGCDANRVEIRHGHNEATDRARGLLHRHVSMLWQLSDMASDLYEAIICGRHGSALRFLETARLPSGLTRSGIVRLIQQHGLLWCTNDLQMILARSASGARNPFGLLASTTQVEMKPERAVNDMKRHLILLRLALDLYATTGEEQDAAAPKPPGSVPEGDELAQLLGRRVTISMARTGFDPVALRPKLDSLIERIRAMRTYGADMWWQELARPVTANELSAHFSGLWFSGLSPVQAAAVTVLRYLQAEIWIERLVTGRMPDVDRMHVRDHPATPRFDASAFDTGLIERAKDLLFLNRREVLRDKMAPTTESTLSMRAKNAGTDPIAIALEFLAKAPTRAIGDDHGDPESRARTLYLLDVIPESRLAR
jgi:hypothetical protein